MRATHYDRQQGLSLVEIMVALVVGLVLLAGVYKVYIGSKQTYRLTENQAQLQENARFAMHFLNSDIRGAGYSGCGNVDNPKFTVVDIAKSPPADLVFSNDKMIEGYDSGAWPGDFPTEPGNLVAGSSVILIRGASACSTHLTGVLSVVNANMQLNNNVCAFQKNDYVFVTDCQRAEIFQATSVSVGAGKVTMASASNDNNTNFLYPFPADSQVMGYQEHMFYIGCTTGGATCPDVDRALYEATVSSTAGPAYDELVGDVAGMQIEYGVDTNNDYSANYYADATDVTSSNEWKNVVSVRAQLLLTSPDDWVVPQKQTYTFNGSRVTAPDHRLYSVLDDTIALRNRTH